MLRIGLIIERHWHYGRRLCEGIAAFSRERGGVAIEFLDADALGDAKALRAYDGFIARVWNAKMVSALRRTRRPVVDVYGGFKCDEFVLVDQNARLIGQQAARHFIEHRFTHFAFCGYVCQRYSVLRREAFVRALQLNRFECSVFEDPSFTAEAFGRRVIGKGDYDAGIDATSLAKWLQGLPKPVAVFCAHDLVAFNLLTVCKSIGLAVPKDVAILGVDNDPLLCDFTNPTISSIDPNPFGIGFAAAETIVNWIGSPRHRPKDVHPAPEGLVERATTQVFPTKEPWVSDALVYIRRNVSRNINAGELFAFLKRSHTVVERTFRAELGRTVHQEIANVKIEEAKRLLERTAIPISEVCRRAGFSSQSYFTAAFSAATGQTPLGWRQSRQ